MLSTDVDANAPSVREQLIFTSEFPMAEEQLEERLQDFNHHHNELMRRIRQNRFQQQFDEKNPHPSPVLERRGLPHFRTNTCCLFPFLEKTLLQFLIPCTFFHNSEPPDSFLLRPESSAMYSIVKEQEIVMAIYYHIFDKSQLN